MKWVALSAAAGLIAHFVGRVSEALAHRERELTAARVAYHAYPHLIRALQVRNDLSLGRDA